jgi:prepilin-type N-terminal cleavage/methylation domain-containing protein
MQPENSVMDLTKAMRRWKGSGGFTLVELLVVVAVIGVVAAIATPGLLRSRVAANEASAIASMRAIVSAQQDFTGYNRGFATDLATLAMACPGGTTPFISPDLNVNGVHKNGYLYSILPGLGAIAGPNDCFGNPTQSTYYATATPLAVGATGNRGFATNIGSAIWQDESGAVPTEPFTMAGTVSPLGR